MTARGVDAMLPQPVDPVLHEGYMTDARGYTALAVRAHGPLPKLRGPGYIWGDARAVLAAERPDARLVNLETAVTTSDDWMLGKAIHYRTSPANARHVLSEEAGFVRPGLDAVVLSNNHVLDWGQGGLLETLDTLASMDLAGAGAGRSAAEAEAPARIGPGGHVLVFGLGAADSGVPREWAAAPARPGVAFAADDFGPRDLEALRRRVAAAKRSSEDVAVLSVHWGSNWGHEIPRRHRRFAEDAIRTAGVDLIHGHSSHHVKMVSVIDGKLVIWSCGDLLSDYEGIDFERQGHDEDTYAPGLGALFFPSLDLTTGRLRALRVVPLRNQKLSLHAVASGSADVAWLLRTLSADGAAFVERRLRVKAGAKDMDLAVVDMVLE